MDTIDRTPASSRGVPLAPALRYVPRNSDDQGDVEGALQRLRDRREKLNAFSCTSPSRTRRWTARVIRDRLIGEIVETGDVVGIRGRDADPGAAIPAGSVFLLVALSPEIFSMLVDFGEDTADLEAEEDCGDDERLVGSDFGAGDPEDAEEDDPAGGNVEDEGENVATDAAIVAKVSSRCAARRPRLARKLGIVAAQAELLQATSPAAVKLLLRGS